eukprot:06119_3
MSLSEVHGNANSPTRQANRSTVIVSMLDLEARWPSSRGSSACRFHATARWWRQEDLMVRRGCTLRSGVPLGRLSVSSSRGPTVPLV